MRTQRWLGRSVVIAAIVATAGLARADGPASVPATQAPTRAAATPATTTASAPATAPTIAAAYPPATAPATRPVQKSADEKLRTAMATGTDALLAMLTRQVAGVEGGEKPVNFKRPPEAREIDKAELAMGVYTLLVVHQVTGDERLKFSSKEMAPLVDAVRSMRSHFTYAVAWQALALSMLPQREEIKADLSAVRDQLWSGSMEGAYSYELPVVKRVVQKDGTTLPEVTPAPPARRPEPWDNSNSQYALLAMWACSDAGLEVPQKYWQQIDVHWRTCQLASGEWPYAVIDGKGFGSVHGGPASMTAAGVASMLVALDRLDTPALPVLPALSPRDKVISAGIARLNADMVAARERMGKDLYFAYGVERAGLATGLRRLGGVDWFREGVEQILPKQKDGGWVYQRSQIAGTSYALLFLARGRAPVFFNRLNWAGGVTGHPRDVAQVTRYLAGTLETPLNWQNVDLLAAEVETGFTWLDEAPVLFVTGKGDPRFSPRDLNKMREFAEGGGLIVSSAAEGDAGFTAAVRDTYMNKITAGRGTVRALEADHPLYTLGAKADTPGPKLLGLSNGVRELWVHSPEDLGATWQLNRPNVQPAHWRLAENILGYASGREPLRARLEPLTVAGVPIVRRPQLAVGRLTWGDGRGADNPEPLAWRRFSRSAALRWGVDIAPVPVRAGDLRAEKLRVVHVTGNGAIVLTPDEKKAIGAYLRAGGAIVAEPAGGNQGFADSIERLLGELYPGVGFENRPGGHPILSGKVAGGADIGDARPRRFVTAPANADRKLDVKELRLDGRPAAVLFTGDVTSGFLGTHTWGIFGWAPGTAEAVMFNALEYLGGKQ